MLYAIVAALVIIVDQWVKYWVSNNIPYGFGSKELIPGIISLVNVHNDGAAFSFLSGSGARIWFIALCGVFTLLVIIALATRLISGKVGRWAAVLVVAGGLGNCIDRIIYGYVQDMFKVELFNFAVFNVADIFITVFCIVFVIYVLVGERKPAEDYDDEDEDEDDEDDDYYEEPKKSRKQKKAEKKAERKASKKAAAVREDFEDEDEPEEKPKKAAHKQKKPNYDSDYEQYKANKAIRAAAEEEPAAKPVRRQAAQAQPVKKAASADPFEQWDAANKKAGTSSAYTGAAQRQAAAQPAAKPVQRAVAPAPQKAAAPVQQKAAAPVQKPVQKAAPAKIEEDFNIDDILAEFK